MDKQEENYGTCTECGAKLDKFYDELGNDKFCNSRCMSIYLKKKYGSK